MHRLILGYNRWKSFLTGVLYSFCCVFWKLCFFGSRKVWSFVTIHRRINFGNYSFAKSSIKNKEKNPNLHSTSHCCLSWESGFFITSHKRILCQIFNKEKSKSSLHFTLLPRLGVWIFIIKWIGVTPLNLPWKRVLTHGIWRSKLLQVPASSNISKIWIKPNPV